MREPTAKEIIAAIKAGPDIPPRPSGMSLEEYTAMIHAGATPEEWQRTKNFSSWVWIIGIIAGALVSVFFF